jgi:hypothetical protein
VVGARENALNDQISPTVVVSTHRGFVVHRSSGDVGYPRRISLGLISINFLLGLLRAYPCEKF